MGRCEKRAAEETDSGALHSALAITFKRSRVYSGKKFSQPPHNCSLVGAGGKSKIAVSGRAKVFFYKVNSIYRKIADNMGKKASLRISCIIQRSFLQ